MKPKLPQIISYFFLALIIANLILFAFHKIPPWLFWSILIIAALITYKILPWLRKPK